MKKSEYIRAIIEDTELAKVIEQKIINEQKEFISANELLDEMVSQKRITVKECNLIWYAQFYYQSFVLELLDYLQEVKIII